MPGESAPNVRMVALDTTIVPVKPDAAMPGALSPSVVMLPEAYTVAVCPARA